MPRPKNRLPSYRRKSDGRAFCVLGGRHIYLGKHGTPESRECYDRVVAEWLANGRQLPGPEDDLSVDEVALRFLRWATDYYRDRSGATTSELDALRSAIRPLHKLYGSTSAREFGPKKLQTVRHDMIGRGWCRTTINAQVGRIRRLFRWAVSEEIIPAHIDQSLRTVAGLRSGRHPEVKERAKVTPVTEKQITATLHELSPTLSAMVRLQLATGMRAGELVQMRTCDLETDGAIWIYSPAHHKTEHHGKNREIFLDHIAQSIIAPRLQPENPLAPLFSPKEADRESRALRRDRRKTPLWPSHVRRIDCRKKCPSDRIRPPGLFYRTDSYRQAIQRACQRAGIPAWTPHQLRHTAGTQFRKEFGLEIARALLGHRSVLMSEHYAEFDRSLALRALETKQPPHVNK